MTKEEIIAGHLAPRRETILELIAIEDELVKSIAIKKEYIQTEYIQNIAFFDREIVSKKGELLSINSEIESRKGELSELILSHETEHMIHGQKISTLRTTIGGHSLEIENKKKEISELEERKSFLTTDISILSKTKKSALDELQKVLKECSEADTKLRVINNEITAADKVYAKISSDIKRISKQKDVLVEDILTDNHRKLYDRHQIQLGKSQALDEQILQKRKTLKEAK